MDLLNTLAVQIAEVIQTEFNQTVGPESIVIQPTKPEFEGDYTVVTFALSKQLRSSPDDIAQRLGTGLHAQSEIIEAFTVVKGFLNLALTNAFWHSRLRYFKDSQKWWGSQPAGQKTLVEYASPNTNKPLHLGHIRNILLGWSIARILEEIGHEVVKVQVINDRGIAICKSMLAWQLWADGQTPEEAGVKPDHFVGDWYVRFEKEFAAEYAEWQESSAGQELLKQRAKATEPDAFFKGFKNTYFNELSRLGTVAREMLRKWELGDPATRALWEMMNGWVYKGFDETYERLGVHFDRLYYESQTYLLGKQMVEEGLAKGVFYRHNDGSVWVDLTDEGLDEKILLRSDGTSVYLTQDLGTAQLRYEDFGTDRMIYVVGDEQNYHFDALFATLRKLEMPYARGLYHLSYGLVDLPTGRMKTREGTVVDADDLMDEVYEAVEETAAERGEITDLPPEERETILRQVSMGALKYFIIKVEPKKRMTFNPEESVDLQGQTGPYIQNAYVRIQSILRKAGEVPEAVEDYVMVREERELLVNLSSFKLVLQQSAEQYNPGHLANYCYSLAKTFHKYYHDYRILNAETEAARNTRLQLIDQIATVLKAGMDLLGIEMPTRM